MAKFALEKKFNGFRAVIIKKGNSIKIYSDQSKDITFPFPTVTKEITQLSNKDLILDCEIVLYENKIPKGRSEIAKYIGAIKSKKEIDDSGIMFHVFDCMFFGKDITKSPWYERKNTLHSLNFTPHVKEVPSIIVDTRLEAEKAIKFLRNLKGSEGSMIKKYDAIYTKGGSTDAWIKFRNEDQLILRVVNSHKKENGYTYTVGVASDKRIHPKYVQNGILILGDTFVTKLKVNEGDRLVVNVEEIWRHKYPKKNNVIRYSFHKPRVIEKTKKSVSTLKDLDDLAVSKGEEIIENTEGPTTTTSPGIPSIQGKVWGDSKKKKSNFKKNEEMAAKGEGGEVMVKNFPDRMQRSFKKILDSGEWKSFVIQWHLRGENSIHTDLRFDVGEFLEGFTLFTPGSISAEDTLTENPKSIRGTIKLPHPIPWLNVNKVLPKEGPGATTKQNAYMVIIAKGKYRPIEITDHKIKFELKTDSGKTQQVKSLEKEDEDQVKNFNDKLPDLYKQLNGNFSYHIAHIGDRWIILFDKVK